MIFPLQLTKYLPYFSLDQGTESNITVLTFFLSWWTKMDEFCGLILSPYSILSYLCGLAKMLSLLEFGLQTLDRSVDVFESWHFGGLDNCFLLLYCRIYVTLEGFSSLCFGQEWRFGVNQLVVMILQFLTNFLIDFVIDHDRQLPLMDEISEEGMYICVFVDS